MVWSAKYGSFGKATVAAESTVVNNLRFPGQYFDAETGLHYNWHRYYDPKIGRYLRTDPAEDGINLYAYCLNSPMNLIDLRGLYWEYAQSTGNMTHVDNQTGARTNVGTGYSGQGSGVNNPNMQDRTKVGPIPQGTWDIGTPRDSRMTGPHVMDLTPRPGTETYGRNNFQIHGDNACGCQSASEGCIVMPRDVRETISNSNDNELRVVK